MAYVLARGGDVFLPQESWNQYMRSVKATEQARAIAARMQPVPQLPVTAIPSVRPPLALPSIQSTVASPAAAIPFVRPPLLPVFQPAQPPTPVVPSTLNLPAPR